MVSSEAPIVLVGPMGVGKTTVGKKLASALGLSFRDTDALFNKEFGNIAEFFRNHGEERFREIETSIVAKALSEPGVIATGGGVVLAEENRKLLSNATVVYLSTDGTHMAKRISQGSRPLLGNGLTDWNRIYAERKPLYEMVADITIDSSGHPIKQTVIEIREALGI